MTARLGYAANPMDRRFGTAPSMAEIEAMARASLERLPEPFAAHLKHVVLTVAQRLGQGGDARVIVARRQGQRAPHPQVARPRRIRYQPSAINTVLMALSEALSAGRSEIVTRQI